MIQIWAHPAARTTDMCALEHRQAHSMPSLAPPTNRMQCLCRKGACTNCPSAHKHDTSSAGFGKNNTEPHVIFARLTCFQDGPFIHLGILQLWQHLHNRQVTRTLNKAQLPVDSSLVPATA